MEPKFVHLRLHTEYSLSDGLLTINGLIAKAQQLKMPALGITDLNNLYAAIKFYQAATAAGIKPIIGVDVMLSDTTPLRLTLLCQNKKGYGNLLKLITKTYLHGQATGAPQVNKNDLVEFNEGLIALSGHQGEIVAALLRHNEEEAKKSLQFMQDLFKDRFYLEITRVGRREERLYETQLLTLAEKYHVPLVATNDVRFLTSDDFEAHIARVAIQQGVTLNDPHFFHQDTEQQYFRTAEEMVTLFQDIPQALKNTVEIAKRCNVMLELGKNCLPIFKTENNQSPEKYITELAHQGLKQRLNILSQTDKSIESKYPLYEERLKRELAVINKMGFASYFLIVADFTKWSKENGIPVGPGRGSGPGSLVAYALEITGLDPIALELLFERFLNPERVSMPDFDIDFCMAGRDRVIEYVMQKHGTERVSQIITYGTMAAKAVVRDVGRVLGLPYGFVDKIAKLIPFELGITLQKAMEQEPLLKERYDIEEDVKTLMDLALKLEGITRNVGKHAGGIVIAPSALTDFVPLYCEPEDSHHPVTQFDKDDVEAVGLVKFDFLGLKTLTIIDRALNIINTENAKKNLNSIDINLISLQDAPTFSLLKNSQSMAVFQLESHGMRDLIKRLQPDCFEDLIALVALFRPGPLQSGMVDDFINRKHGRAKVIYPHPELEQILRPTYGVILYQEQVMQIAQVLAGYTLGAADILRRAMGKKKPEEMAKQREIFIKGATARKVNAEVASYIFDLMEKFAGYGFNKSHSASYALIAYQTAWLKTHYSAAFMAAVLSSEMDKTEKIILLLDDCKNMQLKISPPNINNSHYQFTVINNEHLMYGLGAIKGVGEAAILNIIAAREKNGSFKGLFDFIKRVDPRKINKRVLEALIKSGCFNEFNIHRGSLLASLSLALQHAEQTLQDALHGQTDLLSFHTEKKEPEYVAAPQLKETILLQGEKETLGFYLTGHPLNIHLPELSQIITCRIDKINHHQHKTAKIAGIITNIRMRQTKRGDRMAIFTLDDGACQIECICFKDTFQKFRNMLNEDQLIIIDGEVGFDDFNQKSRVICRELYTLEMIRQRHAKCLKITTETHLHEIETLSHILNKYRGGACQIMFYQEIGNIATKVALGEKWRVNPIDNLLNELTEHFKNAEIIPIY